MTEQLTFCFHFSFAMLHIHLCVWEGLLLLLVSTPLESRWVEPFTSIPVVFEAPETMGLVNRMLWWVWHPSAVFDTFKISSRCCVGKRLFYFGLHTLVWYCYERYIGNIFWKFCLLWRRHSSPKKRGWRVPTGHFPCCLLGYGDIYPYSERSHTAGKCTGFWVLTERESPHRP